MKTKIKKWCFDSAQNLYEGRELVINAFKRGLFPWKSTKGLKIQTSKQIPQRLPIALAQIKAGNSSENLLNAIIFCINQKKLPKKYTIT